MTTKRSTTTKKTPSKKVATASASKKAAAKKTSVKRPRVAKKVERATERPLIVARGEHCFWTTDGHVLKDLVELATAFAAMDDAVFIYHVNQDKNDFADWVEQVLYDGACAADLRRCTKPSSAKVVVRRYIRTYLS